MMMMELPPLFGFKVQGLKFKVQGLKFKAICPLLMMMMVRGGVLRFRTFSYCLCHFFDDLFHSLSF